LHEGKHHRYGTHLYARKTGISLGNAYWNPLPKEKIYSSSEIVQKYYILWFVFMQNKKLRNQRWQLVRLFRMWNSRYRFLDMDMISFGSTGHDAHLPEERARILSAQKYLKFVIEVFLIFRLNKKRSQF
jgi:hypothetical protein